MTISQSLCDKSLTDPTFNRMSMRHVSIDLIKLKINVNTFDDCFYILNGHFECLSILIIDVFSMTNSSSNIVSII